MDTEYRRLKTKNKVLLPAYPQPEVSVVLSGHNDAHNLPYILRAFACQEWEGHPIPFEVIIGDDGSNDEALEVARSEDWPFEVRYIWKQNRGFHLPHILNMGMRLASAPIVVISDMGCLPLPSFVWAHKKLARPGIMVCGKTTEIDANKLYSWKAPWMNADEFWGLLDFRLREERRATQTFFKEDVLYGGYEDAKSYVHVSVGVLTNMGMMREEVLDMGGFDEDFDAYGFQDYELTYRWFDAGKHAIWAPAAHNLNIGRAEQRPVHPKAARLFEQSTGIKISKDVIDPNEKDDYE